MKITDFILEHGLPKNYFTMIDHSLFKNKVAEAEKLPAIINGNDLEFGYSLIIDDNFPVLIRSKTTDIEFPYRYDIPHLRNSLILNLLILPLEKVGIVPTNILLFCLFYCCFFRSRNPTPKDLVQHVSVEIEEMIKILIQKELTLYRGKNVKDAVNILRNQLAVLALGSAVVNLNFRR